MSGTKTPPVAMGNKKEFVGQVVGDKMDKTIVIATTSRKMHHLYKKYVTKTKKLKVHDENNEAHVGDTVRVVESRPISKEKHWRLVEILEKAK